jgi:hypothetical protein
MGWRLRSIVLQKELSFSEGDFEECPCKTNTANPKVAEWKLKEAAWNAERKLLRKQASAGGSSGSSNRCETQLLEWTFEKNPKSRRKATK